ncbi:MAG: hypothetical protein GXP29_04670, partial [Planctomycetes bacterium]|nr:hypothetical protein [Planctomycetota bacterium]
MSDSLGLLELLRVSIGKSRAGDYILLFVGPVFLSFAALHWWSMPPRESWHLPLAIIGGILLAAGIFTWREKRASRHFMAWLIDHRNEIEVGEARYCGQTVSLDTQRVWFMGCVSFAVGSIQFLSRPLLPESRICSYYRFGMTLLSLTCGWWGIPWGPIFTIRALGSNIGGGQMESVRVLLFDLEQEARIAAFED